MEGFSYKSKSESKKQVSILQEEVIVETKVQEREAIEAEQWLTQSPEFTPEKSKYRVMPLEEHSQIFKPFDLSIDQAKKVDSFEFVQRYQQFFSQKIDIQDGARAHAKNLDSKQAVPPLIKLVTLSHNF